jgi:membrane dipeptidase
MIFDGHGDIWTDITQKRLKGEQNIFRTNHLERFVMGGVTGGIFVIWIDPPYNSCAEHRLKEIIFKMSLEINTSGDIFNIIKSKNDLLQPHQEGKIDVVIGLEGMDYITEGELDILEFLYLFGARHASLTWNNDNYLGGGAKGDPDYGLTATGRLVISRMEELGMLVDVSHANDKTFWDIADISTKPFIASHSNCRSLCNHKRNLSDIQLEAIKQSKGLVGINAFPDFISDNKAKVNIEGLAEHIYHMVAIMGIDHVGFGFDFCDYLSDDTMSSFAENEDLKVKGFENVKRVPDLIKLLYKHGFSKEDVEKISYKNFYEVLKNTL